MTRRVTLSVVSLLLLFTGTANAQGPLRVHPDNPRYFAGPDGRAVWLTGSHTWATFQERGLEGQTPDFDFPRYLDFLEQHGHNWCVLDYESANHPPVVTLTHSADLQSRAGDTVNLSATDTTDPDGDSLSYRWWQYTEPGSYRRTVAIRNANQPEASLAVPHDVRDGDTVHIICEVTDSGSPPLTRYQRVIVEFD